MGENMNNQNESAGAVTAEETTGTHGNMEDMESQNRTPQERKYTDADVDRIVKKKIANERKRMQKLFEEGQQLSELEIRERNVLKRELKLDACELLEKNGVPTSLSGILNYESRESMEEGVECITKAFREAIGVEAKKMFAGETPRVYGGISKCDPIKEAFAPKAR